MAERSRRPRRWWFPLFLIAAGLTVVSVLGSLAQRAASPAERLPGWQIIRPPHEVSALVKHRDRILAGGKDGVFGLECASADLVWELDSAVPIRYVRALLVDDGGTLWIGHQQGLTRFDGQNLITYTRSDGLPADRITSLMLDREGRLWAGTSAGAACLEEGNWRTLTAADGLLVDMVNVILQDHLGGIWFGSYTAPEGGLSYLKDGRWQYFTVEQGLPHNNINNLLLHSDGSLWAATGFYDRGGAARLVYTEETGNWAVQEVLGQAEGMPGAKVRSMFQDDMGRLWFGTEYNGIACLINGDLEIFTVQHGLSDNEVKIFLQDSEGNLWLGTHDGITQIDAAALDALGKAVD